MTDAPRPARATMKAVLIAWAAAWPTITVLLLVLAEPTEGWPLPARTLLLTGLMVPAMLLVMVPALTLLVGRIERRWRRAA